MKPGDVMDITFRGDPDNPGCGWGTFHIATEADAYRNNYDLIFGKKK
jgi:hypothetical protein